MKIQMPAWFDELEEKHKDEENLTFSFEIEVACKNGKNFQENFQKDSFIGYKKLPSDSPFS